MVQFLGLVTIIINKRKLNREEKNDAYLIHVCRLLWCLESLEKVEKVGAFSQHCGFNQLYREPEVTLAGATRRGGGG